MRFKVFTIIVISVQNLKAMSLIFNFTVPETVFASATNLSFGNQSITFGNFLFSEVVQDVLDTFGTQLQYIVGQLAVLDDICLHQLLLFVAGLNKMDEWALQMFDATAKFQSGFFEGNMMQVGSFDECLKIDVIANGSQINGQYCTAIITNSKDNNQINPSLKQNLDSKLSYGFCVPSVCDNSSLNGVARLLEDGFQSPFRFNFIESLCLSNVKKKALSTGAMVSLTFFSLVGFIMVFSTIYDIYFYQHRKRPSLYTAFSVYTNAQKLFSTKTSTDSLGCLNGLKVISIMWIIAAHRYLYTIFLPLTNLVEVTKWPKAKASGLFTAGNMAVDTFLVISGLLLVYVYLLHKEKGQNISLGMFYVHRILRLTPALAVMVMFQATLVDQIGFGPFWPIAVDVLQKDCEKNWWSTLLYIQNYINPNDMCVAHSWYLAVDTQLYFLSPILLLPLIKWPKRVFLLVICLVVTCCGFTFGITWWKHLAPGYFGLRDEEMKYLYSVTHIRAPSWLTGVVLGYILFKVKNRTIKINKMMQMILWITSLSVMAGIVVYHERLAKISDTLDLSRLEIAFANSLLRLGWAIGLSIVIFLCATGYGGPVNRFLSNPIFMCLVRINYSVYLVHIMVIIFSIAQARTPQYSSYQDNFYHFWGDYVITSIVAVIWTLSFESPVIVLEKLIFGKLKSKEKAGGIRNV